MGTSPSAARPSLKIELPRRIPSLSLPLPSSLYPSPPILLVFPLRLPFPEVDLIEHRVDAANSDVGMMAVIAVDDLSRYSRRDRNELQFRSYPLCFLPAD